MRPSGPRSPIPAPPPYGRLVLIGGAFVIVLGLAVYWKYRLERSELKAPEESTSSTSTTADEPEPNPATLFEGALVNAPDGVDFNETPSYLQLIRHVSRMSPGDFSARTKRRLDWKGAVEAPGEWRGRFVRVRGVCADLSPMRLLAIGTDIHRGFAAQPDGSEMVAFDYVGELPADLNVGKDVLDLEGVFYRTVKYESKTGKAREVPYLIVRNLAVYQSTPEHSMTGFLVKLAIVIVASIAVAFYLLRLAARRAAMRERAMRGSAGFAEMFDARLRQEKASGRSRPKRE